jgi:DNA-binding CsgD family transcriptional regulator
MVSAATEVVAREQELGELRRFLQFGQLPAGLALVGEPGIGKTTLLGAGIAAAESLDFRVLEARPAEAEAEMAFAALGDLVGGVADEVLEELAPPRRSALSAALMLEDASGEPLAQRAVGLAVLDALRLLATRRRVLVAIDDAQWLDPASRTSLAFALRRLGGLRVAVLAARRPDAPVELGLPLDRIDIGPLSLGALRHLVQRRLGVVLRRPAVRLLHEISGGNALMAIELTRAYERGQITLEPGEPIPTDIAALVGLRVAELPRRTRIALAAAAAAGRTAVETLTAVLGEPAADALAPAVDARIVAFDDGSVGFAHPLLASAAYGLVSAPERRDLHRKLASAATGVARARHLALAAEAPDEHVAAEVENGARLALARGAPAAAAELAGHAARLTPASHPVEIRRRRVLEADARFESGDIERAIEIVEELIGALSPGPARAPLLGRRQRYGHFGEDIDAGIQLSLQALSEAGDDAALCAELHEGLAWGLVRRDVTAALQHAREAVGFAQVAGEPALLSETLATQGVMEFIGGNEPWDLLAEASALEHAVLARRVLRHPTYARAYCLSCADRVAEARAALRELQQRAVEHGDETDLVHILKHVVLLECRAGRWDEAERVAGEAYELALQTGQRPQQASLLSRRALLAALRGEQDDARALAEEAIEIATGMTLARAPIERIVAGAAEVALWALGILALAVDDATEADRRLGPLAGVLLEIGVRDPGELRCLPDAIEAKARLGEVKAAAAWAAMFEEAARSVARPSAVAAAARARGFVEAAQGNATGAVAAFEAALAEAPVELPFERARTLLALGSARRRLKEKKQAREELQRALSRFEQLGAPLWAAKTRAELAAIGGRAPSSGRLTPSELRLAELIREGRSNKEIATALFVTPKTVETKLSRIYAKLGVHSRGQLARLLAERGQNKL